MPYFTIQLSGNFMALSKKITLNLPADLLKEAQEITKEGITETIKTALIELKKKKAREQLINLRGKISFNLDLNKTRA
jgi:hypothetical protein